MANKCSQHVPCLIWWSANKNRDKELFSCTVATAFNTIYDISSDRFVYLSAWEIVSFLSFSLNQNVHCTSRVYLRSVVKARHTDKNHVFCMHLPNFRFKAIWLFLKWWEKNLILGKQPLKIFIVFEIYRCKEVKCTKKRQ